MTNKDPFKNLKLDKEEQMWEDLQEQGKLQSVPNLEDMKTSLAIAARNTRLESKQISMRMNTLDLKRLKSKALSYGMPYQTLLNSLVHRFVTGKIAL